jgi:predicted RNA-binding protein with PUA-like domain
MVCLSDLKYAIPTDKILAESAFDPKHPYYDPKASRDNPKWVVVHVEFRRKLKKQVTLTDLKAHAQPGKPLENLQTLKQSRLSVSSVTPAQWKYILELAGEDS